MTERTGASAREASASQSPRTLRHEAEALASPLPPLLVEAERVASTVAQGVHGRRRSGVGETFWQYRHFRAEDAKSAIDWRQSARSDHLYVRENEWEAAQSVWLWRDASASMDYASSFAPCAKVERATVLALALASLLIRGGERVAVLGEPEPPATGRIALRRLARRLSAPAGAGAKEGGLPPAAPLPRHARVVLLGDFLNPTEDMIARMKALSASGIRGHMVEVLDPAEEDLPFEGRVLFEGVEDSTSLLVGRAQGLRGPYRERLAAHRARLREAARRLGWTFAGHRTDRPPQQALMALYQALAERI